MELTERVVTYEAQMLREGDEHLDLSAGKRFQIRHTDGEVVVDLDEEVPAGKKWHIVVQVYISETDA